MSVAAISQAPSVRFAVAARTVSDEARRHGLQVPAFKSPPRLAKADRSLRRVGRDAVVAVRVRGRPFGAIVADLIEGVVVTNELTGLDAGKARAILWTALEDSVSVAA